MSDWIREDKTESEQGSVAAAVAAAAAEVTALSEYPYVPELDVHYDKTSGYAFKEGCHDFHHASTHYTFHFDDASSSWQCNYEPDWDRAVGCPASLDAFVLLSELVDQVEIGEVEIAAVETVPSPSHCGENNGKTSPSDEMLPCIRAIVLESEELPYGHLSVITVDGGAISCVKSDDDGGGGGPVLLSGVADDALCHIRFDSKTKRFQLEKGLTEGGEEEGELVEDAAISVILNDTTVGKDAVEISHQDRLVVDCGDAGFVILSLHIHKALNTCAGCEPGLLLSRWSGNESIAIEASSSKSKSQLERDRRRELKRIKKKYALSRIDYVENPNPGPKPTGDNYTDRADIRRRTVGSDLPHSAAEAIAETRASTSATKPMDEENKGFRMLQKMGWKQGAGVGKREDGIQQPICPVGHMDSSGLGAHTSLRVAVGDADQARKRFKWTKAAQRYARIEKNAVFESNADDPV